MLAGAGNGHLTARLRLGVGIAVPLIQQGLLHLVEDVLLHGLRPVGRAHHGMQPLRPAGVHHLLEGVVAAAVHRPAVGELHLVHGPALRQGIPPVHQRQIPRDLLLPVALLVVRLLVLLSIRRLRRSVWGIGLVHILAGGRLRRFLILAAAPQHQYQHHSQYRQHQQAQQQLPPTHLRLPPPIPLRPQLTALLRGLIVIVAHVSLSPLRPAGWVDTHRRRGASAAPPPPPAGPRGTSCRTSGLPSAARIPPAVPAPAGLPPCPAAGTPP